MDEARKVGEVVEAVRKDIETYMLEMDERVSRLEKRAEVVSEELAKLRNLAANIVSTIEELNDKVTKRRPTVRQPSYAEVVVDEFLASGKPWQNFTNEEIRTYPINVKPGATLRHFASTFATTVKRAAERKGVNVNAMQRGEDVLLLNEPPRFQKRNGKKGSQ